MPQTFNMPKAIESIEDHLFSGSRKAARRELLAVLGRRKIERRYFHGLASLARLADLPERGVALLHRTVHPPQGRKSDATDMEQAVYAQCLAEIGLAGEALKILEKLNPRKLPRVLLYRAFCHIWRWEWRQAVELLEKLTVHPEAISYEKLAARVWLAGALVRGPRNLHLARKILAETLSEATPDFGRVLHKHGRRFLIEALVLSKRWENAQAEIAELEKINTDDDDPYFTALIGQQRCLIDFGIRKDKAAASRGLEKSAALFREQHQWEDARGTELLRAEICEDRDALAQLYIGTPSAAFRELVRDRLAPQKPPGPSCEWRLEGAGPSCPDFLDLTTGESSFGRATLKEGHILHRLLEALSADFYRPQRITELHERLYPGEYFNPSSSPDRVHQILKRLRQWLKSARVPLEILEHDGLYELRARRPLVLRLKVDRAAGLPESRSEARMRRDIESLGAYFADRHFTSAELAKKLRCSQPTAVRLLREGVKAELIERIGAGPSARYRLRPSAT